MQQARGSTVRTPTHRHISTFDYVAKVLNFRTKIMIFDHNLAQKMFFQRNNRFKKIVPRQYGQLDGNDPRRCRHREPTHAPVEEKNSQNRLNFDVFLLKTIKIVPISIIFSNFVKRFHRFRQQFKISIFQ